MKIKPRTQTSASPPAAPSAPPTPSPVAPPVEPTPDTSVDAAAVPQPEAPAPPPVKQPGVPVINRDPAPPTGTALMHRPENLPSHIEVTDEGVADGLENSAGDALQLPLVFLSQAQSPQVMEGHMPAGSVYLSSDPNAKLFGPGEKVNFIPFFHFKEWIEWAPRETGEGMISRSKNPKGELARAWQTQWARRRAKNRGEDVPKADSHIDEYHVFFLFFEDNYDEPVALPMSRTKHKKGRLLISLALRRGRGVPLYAGMYAMSSYMDKNKKDQRYYNFDFEPAGWTAKLAYEIGKKAYQQARDYYEALSLQFEQAPKDETVEEASDY